MNADLWGMVFMGFVFLVCFITTAGLLLSAAYWLFEHAACG